MIKLVWQPTWFDLAGRQVSHSQVPESGLLRDALPAAALADLQDLQLARNGVRLRVDDLDTEPVADGDIVWAARVPGGIETVGLIIISFLANIVAGALVPKLKQPREREDNSSPTYGWRGIESNRGEGAPIPVVFGRIRAGGQIINEFFEQRRHAAANADYYVQLSFGEGPIHSIAGVEADTPADEPRFAGIPSRPIPAGIQVNGLTGDTLEGVEAHIRLGTNEQEPSPGFEFTATPISVDTPLQQNAWTSTFTHNPVIQLTDSQAVQDAAWDAFGVTVDLNADLFDAARLHLELPAGLSFQASNGPIYPARVRVICRYQELTEGGSPITTGGQFNDGWVRLPDDSIYTKQFGAFGVDLTIPFHDPATYTAPSYGKSLGIAPGASPGNCVVASPTLPAAWVDAALVTEMSGEVWAEFDQLDFDSGNPSHTHVADHVLFQQTPGTAKGFRFAVRKRTFQSAPGVTADYWVPTFELSGTVPIHELTTSSFTTGTGLPTVRIAQSDRHHYAWTYKANVDGTKDRLRIFVDGELVWELIASLNLRYSDEDIQVGRDPLESQSMQGRLDEFRLLHREMTISEVRQSYNYGRGIAGDATIPGLVCGLNFNDNSTSVAADYSPFGNDAALTGSAGSTLSEGFVLTVPGNTRKRSRWRLQVMRNNLDSIDQFVQDDIELASVDGLIDEAFSYPNSPRLDLRIEASEQISGSAPDVSAVVEGYLLHTWDGTSEDLPVFEQRYSRNPAWCAATWALARRFGLGDQFKPADIDVASLKEWADYCDELVYDRRGDRRQGNLASGSLPEYTNMVFRESLAGAPEYDGRGQILITFGATPPPEHWEVGGYIGWYGEAVATGHVDSNVGDTGGYEILYIGEQSGVWSVSVAWDRLDEGTPWDHDTSLDTNSTVGVPYKGTMEGRERRFTYDAVHDQDDDAWDVLLGICAVGRAAPILEGQRLRFFVDKPREHVAVIGMGQILEGSFEMEYLSLKDRPNQLAMQFLDEDLNYEQSLARLAHPSISATTDSSAVREETVHGRGIVRRSQALRHLKLELNENELITRKGKFECATDAIHFLVGDVVQLSHDLVLWGESGRLANLTDQSEVFLDRTITVEAATTYYLQVRNDRNGEWSRATVDVATLGTGTHPAGTPIPLSPGLPFVPQGRAPYVWYADGEEFYATITAVRLLEDLKVEVSWSEYVPELHDDTIDDLPPATGTVTEPSSELALTQPPPEPLAVRAEEVSLTRRDGSEVPGIRVSWGSSDDGARRTGSWVVWYRVVDEGAERPVWDGSVIVDSTARTTEIELPSASSGSSYAVAVQPVSHGGSKRPAEQCPQARLVVQLDGLRPQPVTNLQASFVDDQVVYSWDLPETGPNLVVEARRGGWLLGQRVFTSPPGSINFGPTSNWSEGTLYVRTRSASGHYSEPVMLELSTADLDVDADLVALGNMSDEWSGYEDGWVDDGDDTAPNAFLTNLARQSDGSLAFDGSGLVGVYTTPDPTVDVPVSARELYLEACAEATQVAPLTWEDADFAWGSSFASALTWEGLAHSAARAAAPVRLVVEVRLTLDGTSDTWTNWRPFQPAKVIAAGAQFRIRAIRQDDGVDCRITGFQTQVRGARPSLYDRTPQELFLRRELETYG